MKNRLKSLAKLRFLLSELAYLAASYLIILAFCWQPVAAFKSFRAYDVMSVSNRNRGTGYIHGEITKKVLQFHSVRENYVATIIEYNWHSDWDEMKKTYPPPPILCPRPNNKCYSPAHHFDRNEIGAGKHEEAFRRGANYVREQRGIIISGLRGVNGVTVSSALQATGRALHALQDLFAHSNVVDLSPTSYQILKTALKNAAAPPPELRITGFNVKTGGDLQLKLTGDPCESPNDYGHDKCSKDDFDKNEEAKKKVAEGTAFFVANKTKFEAAKDAAVTYCQEWLQEIRTEVGEDNWRKITKSTDTYEITVQTGDRKYAGTDSKVSIKFFFDVGSQSGDEELADSLNHSDPFERKNTDVFLVEVLQGINFNRIQIARGSGDGWFLEQVNVRRLRDQREWKFPCGRWFAEDEEDRKTIRILDSQQQTCQ